MVSGSEWSGNRRYCSNNTFYVCLLSTMAAETRFSGHLLSHTSEYTFGFTLYVFDYPPYPKAKPYPGILLKAEGKNHNLTPPVKAAIGIERGLSLFCTERGVRVGPKRMQTIVLEIPTLAFPLVPTYIGPIRIWTLKAHLRPAFP